MADSHFFTVVGLQPRQLEHKNWLVCGRDNRHENDFFCCCLAGRYCSRRLTCRHSCTRPLGAFFVLHGWVEVKRNHGVQRGATASLVLIGRCRHGDRRAVASGGCHGARRRSGARRISAVGALHVRHVKSGVAVSHFGRKKAARV